MFMMGGILGGGLEGFQAGQCLVSSAGLCSGHSAPESKLNKFAGVRVFQLRMKMLLVFIELLH